MSTVNVIPCGCCRDMVEVDSAFFDGELQAHVCEDCRNQLRAAKAQLARPWCQVAGEPSAIVNLKGVYRGEDAPDNQYSA